MTTDQIRRTIDALVETNRLIANEERYPAHLQHIEVLNGYRAHKAKLHTMLAPELAAL
jgi:hypothetical protein